MRSILVFILSFGIAFAQPLAAMAQMRVPEANEPSVGTMSIHVLGEVTRPGSYELRPNDRIVKALQLAGGVTELAAVTRIELRRGKQPPKIIDLLKLNREGDLKMDPFLQENDIIFVPAKKAAAVIQGPVRYPAVYEIAMGETTSVRDLIDEAGGFTAGLAVGEPIIVIRYDETNHRRVFSVKNNPDETGSFKLRDGDTVQIPHKFTIHNKFDDTVAALPDDHFAIPSASKEVFVLGGVKMPGKFPFVPELRLNKYVAMAGGLSRLGREDLLIYRMDGNVTKSNLNSPIPVNPGDTIVVNEDKLGPEFWITFMTTLVSLSLTAYAISK